MTKKNHLHIPSDEDLVRRFSGQAFNDMVVRHEPKADVKLYSAGALADARVYARDIGTAVKHNTTDANPLISPHLEIALAFVMGLQATHLMATGRKPTFTAHRVRPSSFAKIAKECLHLLGSPGDAIRLINLLQTRSNKMTARRGQEKRKPDPIS